MRLKNLLQIQNCQRYIRYAPNYLSGVAKARTMWGDEMFFPFPEFRTIKDSGIIDHSGEIALAAYLLEHIGPSDIFFDVGANAGYFSVLAKHLGAKVHAFEPMPGTFKILLKNAGLHGFYAWNVAVAEHADGLWMKKDSRGTGWSSIGPGGTVRVTGMALDEFPIVPTFIKIDVEGYQMPVLHGAKKLLAEHHPKVMIELDRNNMTGEEKEFLFTIGYSKMQLLGHPYSANYLFEAK